MDSALSIEGGAHDVTHLRGAGSCTDRMCPHLGGTKHTANTNENYSPLPLLKYEKKNTGCKYCVPRTNSSILSFPNYATQRHHQFRCSGRTRRLAAEKPFHALDTRVPGRRSGTPTTTAENVNKRGEKGVRLPLSHCFAAQHAGHRAQVLGPGARRMRGRHLEEQSSTTTSPPLSREVTRHAACIASYSTAS